MSQNERLSSRASRLGESVTLAMTFKAKEMQAQGLDIIGLGAGELDFPTPEGVVDSAFNAARNGATRYTPVAGTLELRKAICASLKRDFSLDYDPTDIVVSNGAKQSIFNALSVILDPGDKVVIPTPCWLSYPEMIKFLDAELIELNTADTNFRIDPSALDKACTGARAILINTPSNPSGAVMSLEELQAIAQAAIKHDLIVIADEIYARLCYDHDHISLASLPDMKERTILVNGVSKSHAMTGWRIGFTASPAVFAKGMSNLQSHSTSNAGSVSQAAALSAISNHDKDSRDMAATCKGRRDRALKAAQNIDDVTIAPAEGAFYLFINVSSYIGSGDLPKDDIALAEMLLEKFHVGVVPGTPFLAPGHIRISYAGDIDRIVEGIERISTGLSSLREKTREVE